MSIETIDGQEVIVVVTSPSSAFGLDDDVTAEESAEPARKKRARGRAQVWDELCTVPSNEALTEWFKESETASGYKWCRRRTSFTSRGAKEYFQCTGVGCLVQLEALYESSSENIIISTNGKEHEHEERSHSGWGLPEETKSEVTRLFRAGITKAPAMDSELRQLGVTNYTTGQLTSFLARLRRQTRDESVLEEYSELSVWSSGGRDSPDGAASPAPKRTAVRIVTKSLPSLPAPAAQQTTMDEATIAQLVASSLEARSQAYCAYSQFAVGAALLCADGHVVTGCNVENASYGLTNCAERTAVFRAVAEGRRQFSAVAITADMGDVFVGPCGACRQVLAEFNPEMPVILAKPDGQTKRTSMKELLPMPFLPKDVPFKK